MRLVTDLDAPLVAAIDPGGVTGVAIYFPDLGSFKSLEVPFGSDGFAPFFRDVLEKHSVLAVVVEKFTITPATATKTRQYDALEIIGWLKLQCPWWGIPFFLQTPSAAKAFGTDAKLRTLGWYDRTPGGHRNDAARHLVKYLVDTRDAWTLKRLEEGL